MLVQKGNKSKSNVKNGFVWLMLNMSKVNCEKIDSEQIKIILKNNQHYQTGDSQHTQTI